MQKEGDLKHSMQTRWVHLGEKEESAPVRRNRRNSRRRESSSLMILVLKRRADDTPRLVYNTDILLEVVSYGVAQRVEVNGRAVRRVVPIKDGGIASSGMRRRKKQEGLKEKQMKDRERRGDEEMRTTHEE